MRSSWPMVVGGLQEKLTNEETSRSAEGKFCESILSRREVRNGTYSAEQATSLYTSLAKLSFFSVATCLSGC